MKSEAPITAERLRELIHYDPETGVFTRIKNGRVTGTPNDLGYLRISVDDRLYRAHRLAWLWMTGEWPKAQIDHINRKPDDNRWINLREATQAENAWNVSKRKDNTSGHKGVYWFKKAKLWLVQVKANRKLHYIGYYRDLSAAVAARDKAIADLHGDFARGS
jgi:hypothetical protein